MNENKINEVALATINEWVKEPYEYADDDKEHLIVILGAVRGICVMAEELKKYGEEL